MAAPGGGGGPKGPRPGGERPDKTVPEQYLGLESRNNLRISAEKSLKTKSHNYAALSQGIKLVLALEGS